MPMITSNTGRLLLGVLCGFVLGIVLYQSSGMGNVRVPFVGSTIVPVLTGDPCGFDTDCQPKFLGCTDTTARTGVGQTGTCNARTHTCNTTPMPCPPDKYCCPFGGGGCTTLVAPETSCPSGEASYDTLAACTAVCAPPTSVASVPASIGIIPVSTPASIGINSSSASLSTPFPSSLSCNYSLPECVDCVTVAQQPPINYTLPEAQAHCQSVCCGVSTSASASQALCCNGQMCVPFMPASSIGAVSSTASSVASLASASAGMSVSGTPCGATYPACDGVCPPGKDCFKDIIVPNSCTCL